MNIVHQIFRRVRTNFPRTITLGPHRVKLPAGHLLDWNRLRHRRYDEPLAEISALLAAKYPGMCAIDIGANVGDTAAMMVVSPDISVLCVEGNPAYVPLLIENLSRISPSSEVEENYAGFEDTEVSASVETAAGTASIVTSGQAEPGQAPLRLRRLESILIDHPRFQDARLIKIDTDGFDAKIVMAASLAIRRMRPVLLVEYSPVGPVEVERECRAMIDCLCEIGYVHFHIFDNFGNHMLRLSEADTHQMRALNAYVRSSRQDLRPAFFTTTFAHSPPTIPTSQMHCSRAMSDCPVRTPPSRLPGHAIDSVRGQGSANAWPLRSWTSPAPEYARPEGT